MNDLDRLYKLLSENNINASYETMADIISSNITTTGSDTIIRYGVEFKDSSIKITNRIFTSRFGRCRIVEKSILTGQSGEVLLKIECKMKKVNHDNNIYKHIRKPKKDFDIICDYKTVFDFCTYFNLENTNEFYSIDILKITFEDGSMYQTPRFVKCFDKAGTYKMLVEAVNMAGVKRRKVFLISIKEAVISELDIVETPLYLSPSDISEFYGIYNSKAFYNDVDSYANYIDLNTFTSDYVGE